MRVNVDVSDLVRIPYVSGIQRVGREIVSRLIRDPHFPDTRLLRFDLQSHRYGVVSHDSFVSFLGGATLEVDIVDEIAIEDLGASDLFYDIDSVWNSPLKRAFLYPILKSNGVFIATTIYDLVPVMFPQFAHTNTVRNWLTFIASVYSYADLVLPISRSTELDFLSLKSELGIGRHIPSVVTKLGGDIAKAGPVSREELRRVKTFIGQRYLLFVGTVEPRKGQLQALAAFETIAATHRDVHLVFVGREGWHSEKATAGIRKHPLYGKRVHWLEGVSDSLVAHLYDNAHLCLYLSAYEGYGLPVAESLSHGRITIASRNSSMYEVGRDLADYTFFDSPDEIAQTASLYLSNDALHRARSEAIRAGFSSRNWDTVYATISHVLTNLEASLRAKTSPVPRHLQFVAISNDPARMSNCIERYDRLAPFVSRYLVVCPAAQAEEMAQIRSDREVIAVTEEAILGDRLSEFSKSDHQRKNWMLRASLATSIDVDEEFVMLDDDNLPLVPIDVDTFINRDRTYNAYFSHDLIRWAHRETSYDRGQHETLRALDTLGLELVTYSAHQPQVINKSLFAEAVAFVDAVAPDGRIDEWSAYFNVAVTRYPALFTKRRYESMNWPGAPTDWTRAYKPERYTFENYYPSVYESGQFKDIKHIEDTASKIIADSETWRPFELSRTLYEGSRADLAAYDLAHGTVPVGAAFPVQLFMAGLPKVLTMSPESVLHLETTFHVLGPIPPGTTVEIGYEVDSGPTFSTPIVTNLVGTNAYLTGQIALAVRSGDMGVGSVKFFAIIDGVHHKDAGTTYVATLVVAESAKTATELRSGLDRVLHKTLESTSLKLSLFGRLGAATRIFSRRVLRRILWPLVTERRRFVAVSAQIDDLHSMVLALNDSIGYLTAEVQKLRENAAQADSDSDSPAIRDDA